MERTGVTASGVAADDAEAREMVCAWCEHHGREFGAARRSCADRWRRVSLGYVRARWRTATHGVCQWCLPMLARSWGVEQDLYDARPELAPAG